MDAKEYLQQVRDSYVDRYRTILRSKREEGSDCTAEVWVEPNVPAGQPRPPHPLCVDIMVGDDEKPGMVMIAGDAIDGGLMGILTIGQMPVKVYAIAWEAMPVWIRHPDPDWTALQAWRKKWMNVDGSAPSDEDGLGGLVHYMGSPVAEGGGHLYEMDFGSAPVDALMELLDAIAGMGASEVEIGRSDGSDFPADIQAELKQPELPMDRLMQVTARLLSQLPEVERIEIASPEQINVHAKPDRGVQQVYLGNLHRLLQRTGVEARAKELARYLRGQRESIIPDRAPDLSHLRIAIKDDRFLENIRQLGPKMKPLLKQNLAADLCMVCVWDAPNGMRFADETEAELYGFSPAQMLERARQNFLDCRPEPELSTHDSLLVARTGDCYDAALILDDRWCDEMAARVKGALLACVPSRNICLLGGASNSRTPGDLRKAARRIESGGDHLISSTILIRRDGRWERFEEPVSPPPLSAHLSPVTAAPMKRPWWKFW